MTIINVYIALLTLGQALFHMFVNLLNSHDHPMHGHCHFPHFADKEMVTKRLNDLPMVT